MGIAAEKVKNVEVQRDNFQRMAESQKLAIDTLTAKRIQLVKHRCELQKELSTMRSKMQEITYKISQPKVDVWTQTKDETHGYDTGGQSSSLCLPVMPAQVKKLVTNHTSDL